MRGSQDFEALVPALNPGAYGFWRQQRGPGRELLTPVQLGSARHRAAHVGLLTPGGRQKADCQLAALAGASGGYSNSWGLGSGQQQPAL